jgi:hypothetical protein
MLACAVRRVEEHRTACSSLSWKEAQDAEMGIMYCINNDQFIVDTQYRVGRFAAWRSGTIDALTLRSHRFCR